jgi:hypothetical protein
MIQPGKYEAKIADYGVRETAAGQPYIVVYFDIEGQGQVRWQGHMTEKTMEKTFEALSTMGMTSSDISILANGPLSNALNMSQKVQVTVFHEADMKDASKKYAKVKWINPIGGAKFDAQVAAQAKDKLASLNGKWAEMRALKGIKAQQSAEKDLGF